MAVAPMTVTFGWQSQRVAAYLGHLRNVDDGERFYSKSLQADEMGVARGSPSWLLTAVGLSQGPQR